MRLLSEIRNYMGNYHVKSGVFHYYRSEFNQAVTFLRKALADESTLANGDRDNARSYLTLSLTGLAEKLAAEGDIEGGVEQLRNAAKVDPGYPDIHFLMAGLLERIDRRGDAVEAYRKAIECNDTYLEARVALGHCLLSAGNLEEAAEVFGKALELKLEGIRTPFDQGMQDLREGRIDPALESLHVVFRAAPRLSEEHMRKALEWMRTAEYERALHDLDCALDASPRYPDLHNLRGIVLCEMERYDEAVEALRRSAELCPHHKVPRLNLAFAFIRAARLDDAEVELESILKHDPSEPVARASLVEVRAGRLAEKRGQGART